MKKILRWGICSFVLLFLLPLCAAKFAGSGGMALCFVMFFALNPIFFAAEGIAAGKCVKTYWFLPLASALCYILSMWVVFDMGETAFLLYAGAYLAIGTAAMLITAAICTFARKRNIPGEKVAHYSAFAAVVIVIVLAISILGVWKYNRTFTPHRWMENEESRHLIVNDMLSKHELVGMSEEEIVRLLGEEYDGAPERFKYPRGEFPDESTLTYYLGVDFMDNNWIIIPIKDGRAVRCEIGLT